jgi:hypothetical protein
MKQKKSELAVVGSSNLGEPAFNVIAEREALQATRKQKFDAPVLEYQRRMANAPELLKQELEHLRVIGPKVKLLAGQMLAKYPEPPPYEPQGVKNTVNKLRRECIGAENRLSSLVPAITNLLHDITFGAAQHLGPYQVDAMVKTDQQLVDGFASRGKSFTDFAERIASMEKEIADKVKRACEDERRGTGAPVERSGPLREEQIQGMGGVITNIERQS